MKALEYFMKIGHEQAFYIYHSCFREYKEIFFAAAIILVFVLMLWHLFRWMTRYFTQIDQGIDALLQEGQGQICLSPEMLPFERKLNAVKQELEEQKAERAMAEQRKDELVMYLAHDIRTPLTSVIGYLNLLVEVPDLPVEQKEKYVRISLEKAYRLEKMINEFFEITRYNLQQITLRKKSIDLYYMLVQLIDEISPLLSERNNRIRLEADENLRVFGDSDKLARVFQNVLRNAAAYSFPDTEIVVSAAENGGAVEMVFHNEGDTIPKEKLRDIFEKFYRLDEGRNSYTGGSGLGLAIAKEIIRLHGGSIEAKSADNRVSFVIRIPAG